MGTEERKKREKERRRNAIVDAAEKVIFTKGIEQATMDEIAEEAELSKGTLYIYFKNKNELYMAICERGSNLLNDQLGKIFSGDHSGLELVRMMGETYLTFVRNNPEYFNAFIFYETMEDVQELKESSMAQTCEKNMREAMNFMVRALQIGMQDGTINSSYDPKELAVMLWASTRGITMIHHMKEKGHHFKIVDEMDVDVPSLFENFLNILGTGMATEKARNKKLTGSQNSETN